MHRGRIDTRGFDEDIIEYKRAVNENVIYLDWLLDHRKEFQWLAMEKLGPGAAQGVDWSARLICIAGDFTRYDERAGCHGLVVPPLVDSLTSPHIKANIIYVANTNRVVKN